MKYKISIILPIYNVENYLTSALNSIINQSIGVENLEVIMVDDCSEDNSRIIIQDYANKYKNFIPIFFDKNSRGAGKPRNAGLKYATSDFILFLDPDDEFMPNTCEILYNEMLNEDADIISSNALFIKGNKKTLDLYYNEKYYDIIPNKNLELFKPYRVWGTLFKKSLIVDNNIYFIDVATNEDTYFTYSCFLNADRIIYLNDFCGVKHYERNSDEFMSLSHSYDKFHILGTIDAFKEILCLISNSNPNKDYTYDPFILNIFIRFNYKWDMSNKDKKEVFNKILEYEYFSNYIIKLPFHFKIMNFLLNNKLFNSLIVVQILFSSILELGFFKRLLLKSRSIPVG